MADDPIVKVASDLTAILEMAANLDDQAEHKANAAIDGTGLPGGMAMVALGPSCHPDDWAELIAFAELRHYDRCPNASHKDCVIAGAEHVEDEDEWEPPLQTLLFWSEAWRGVHGYPMRPHPTVTTEAGFIRWALNWAWDNEPHWDDFARDIRRARTRLEDVLLAGVRLERGAPCMYPACHGARLTRAIDDRGERTDWRCPSCGREWDEGHYASMVTAAHEASKFEDIEGETWCSVKYAERKTGRSAKTIRTWIIRGELDTVCLIAGRRAKFVRLEQVRERHEAAKRPRGRAA